MGRGATRGDSSSMSATQDQPINLNTSQIAAILNYAVSAGMYDGALPEDPERRLSDASTLVWHARRARDNGNTSDAVKEIVFLADVDQKAQNVPPASPPQGGLIDPAAAFAPPSPPSPPSPPAPVQNGGST